MSKGIPADDGNAQSATSPAGKAAAASAGLGYTGNGSGQQPEVDEDDDDWSPVPGRSYDQDVRIAVHEAGHAVAARLLGHSLGGATVDPGPGYEGRVWGERHTEAFTERRGDASDIRKELAPMMPQAGEDRSSMCDVFANIYGHSVELMAGRAAERMLLGDDDTRSAGHDLRQARELAMLICFSEEAIDSFLSHADVAARDLLMPHGAVVMTLQLVLRIKRELTGSEIDKIISDVLAREALAAERARRREWVRRIESAAAFKNDPALINRRSNP
jgi:hypothetical protein